MYAQASLLVLPFDYSIPPFCSTPTHLNQPAIPMPIEVKDAPQA